MNAQELINILEQHPDATVQYSIDEYSTKVSSCVYIEKYNMFVLS